MKPVVQSKLYQPDAPMRGNCRAACVASLLEVPLWMVPPIEDMRGDLQEERWNEWLERLFGLEFVRLQGDGIPPADHYIACGPSPRSSDIYHSVVYTNGALAHDPHPSGAGVLSVEWTWHLREIREAHS